MERPKCRITLWIGSTLSFDIVRASPLATLAWISFRSGKNLALAAAAGDCDLIESSARLKNNAPTLLIVAVAMRVFCAIVQTIPERSAMAPYIQQW